MTQEIWLMRHGHYHLDSGSLTETGIEQVKKAAIAFKDKAVAVYSSPATRCIETAKILKDEVTQSEWCQIPWVEYGTLPENCLSYFKGYIVVVVSHQLILCEIAKQLGINNVDSREFNPRMPVKL